MLFDEFRQVIHEDLTKPGEQFRLRRAAKLAKILSGAKHRFLDHVGCAEPRLESMLDLRRGKDH